QNEFGQSLTKRLVIGGEALLANHLDYLINNNISMEIINEYGPTEATVGCTTYSFHTSDQLVLKQDVSIGKPIDNSDIYIVDKRERLVPLGVPGELWIGGAGLAKGYLNRPELTAERFIKDPFKTTENSRVYKTGDLAKWLPDGNLKYLGRIDDQVKVRGYRIELGEVENALLQNGLFDQVVVLAKEDKEGSKRLAAYIVTDESFNKEECIANLKGKLPEYMIPTVWQRVEKI